MLRQFRPVFRGQYRFRISTAAENEGKPLVSRPTRWGHPLRTSISRSAPGRRSSHPASRWRCRFSKPPLRNAPCRAAHRRESSIRWACILATSSPKRRAADYRLSRYLRHSKPSATTSRSSPGFRMPGSFAATIRDKQLPDRRSFTSGPDSFRNTISLDQFAASHLGARHAVRQPDAGLRAVVHAKRRETPRPQPSLRGVRAAFPAGSPTQIAAQTRRLREGQSIMDLVGDQAAADAARTCPLARSGPSRRILLRGPPGRAAGWCRRRNGRTGRAPASTPPRRATSIPWPIPSGHLRLMYDLIHLALQTDSTRLITLHGGLLGSQPVDRRLGARLSQPLASRPGSGQDHAASASSKMN